jgi:hypothetical protein
MEGGSHEILEDTNSPKFVLETTGQHKKHGQRYPASTEYYADLLATKKQHSVCI